MNIKALKIDKITLHRGERTLLRDFSLNLPANTAMALSGKNGAGKSSLLRAIAGFLPLESGTISGFTPAQIHYCGHLDALKPSLTVEENLQFWCDWNKTPLKTMAFETVGLNHLASFPVNILSQGQKKRLSLARLIAIPRALWLLDEPTNALDEAGQDLLEQLVKNHINKGGLALIATHQKLAFCQKEVTL
jgi:heme exporter protein A